MRRYDLHQHLIRMHGWVKLGRGQVVESVDAEFDLPPTPKGDLGEGVSDCRLRGPLLPYISRNFSEYLILAILERLFSSLKLCIANNISRCDIM